MTTRKNFNKLGAAALLVAGSYALISLDTAGVGNVDVSKLATTAPAAKAALPLAPSAPASR